MSQIPFIDPSRLGPAAGGSRSPLSLSPDQGASSFNDHLERAGRPTEQTPRGETHSAAATPQDETPPRRQTQIDGSRSTDRPLASDPQADAGTTEDSVGDSGVTEPASTEADADQPPVEEDEVSGEDDVLQLSGDVAIVESQGSTEAAAIAHDVPVGPDETGTNEEANSAIAGSRRRLRGGNAEGSAASGVIKDAADGAADETASDVAGRRAGVAAAGSRAAVRELVTSAEGIEADESKEAQHTTISTTKNRPSGPKLSADASTTRVASNGPVENDAPADTAAEVTSTQSGDRTNGLVDGAAQTSTSKSRRPATNQSHDVTSQSHDVTSDVELSPGPSASRRPSSQAQSTPVGVAAETIPIQNAELAAASDVESDRPGETSSGSAKVTLGSTGEIDRTTPQRGTLAIGSRWANDRLGESERGSVDRTRFVSRVAGAFQAAGRDGGEVRLRLHPPELGVVRLEVKMDAGVMTVRFETETPSARTALLENMAALRERLAEQGIKIEKFNVDLMDRRSEDTPYGPPGGNDREDDRPAPDGETSSESFDRRDGRSEESPSSNPDAAGSAGQLNVVI